MSYTTKIYKKSGGDEQIIASGGIIDIESGGAFKLAGTEVTATATEINMASDISVNTELVSSAKTISASESGKTFFLNSATGFACTLPSPALGLRYRFIVSIAPSGSNHTIVTNASANIIKGHVICSADAAGDTETSGGDTITFASGSAVAGDCVEVISDGTSWFVRGTCAVAAGVLSQRHHN
jgi:hypothetical protein